jgi:hypothetical protein
MIRLYHHYKHWEDFHAGLYNDPDISTQQSQIRIAESLLSDIIALREAMLRVLQEWKIASEVNLSNSSRNRRAWLGQSACCIEYGIPESLTKQAWHLLNEDQQKRANNIAEGVISIWEKENAEKIFR